MDEKVEIKTAKTAVFYTIDFAISPMCLLTVSRSNLVALTPASRNISNETFTVSRQLHGSDIFVAFAAGAIKYTRLIPD